MKRLRGTSWSLAAAFVTANVAFGGPNSEAIDKAIDDAELIVAARPLAFDPPLPPQGEWRQIGTRVDVLLEVTDVLEGESVAGGTIRVAHYRPADHEEVQRPDITEHNGHNIWFLIRRARGIHTVVNRDKILDDSPRLRQRIEQRLRTERGFTRLFIANDADDVAKSLRAGLDADAQDANGDTALHWATEHNRPEVARALLDAGATTHLVNRNGQNVLDVAVHLERHAIVAVLRDTAATARGLFLLEKPLSNYDAYLALGADVNAQASDGTTPIARRLANLSSGWNESDVEEKLRWLLDHGADADGHALPESLDLRSRTEPGR